MFSTRSEHLCRRFSLKEILLATNNFDDSMVIGKGGFGKVYKGEIIDNTGNGASSSTTVAIKRFNPSSKQGASEFWTEINMLSMFRHSHVVSLIGYCDSYNEMILVYEYMVLKICIGAARGLDYLHTGTAILNRVIHLDVKSSNILLDENWAAKILDFGLSRIGPAEQECSHVSTTHIKGTIGYIDPDYLFTNTFTRKSDVYAFGVVLLEVLCERPAVDQSLHEDQWGLAGWGQQCIKEGASHRIIGPNLKWEILPNSLTEFVQIADQCLHSRPKQRPTMSEVVARLEHALALQLRTNLVIEEYSFDTCLSLNNQENVVSYREDDHIAAENSKDRLGLLKRFSLRELQAATHNFSNRNIVGRGRFGNVYKGRLADGTLVALKRRKEECTPGGECMFQTEVHMKSMAVHCNLLRLLGFCMTSTERVLVYPFMANGSVASCLRERSELQSALNWPKRKQIALGSARGLEYLHDHCNPKIIHRDIKASNIFLDEEFEAVVGDFGLAKLMDYKDMHVTTVVRGTIGHIAPEYLSTGKAFEKTDVFGYGVMLLELITGQRAFDLARLASDDDAMLLDWLEGLLKKKKLETLVDANLNCNYNDYEVEQLIEVALLCTHGSPTERPKMSEVVRMLEGDGLSKRWEEWQNAEIV